jgi:mannosyl-3-phosphoglycerate phosphatase
MMVFITDLDGTLLDGAYSYDAAKPALKLLDQLRIPLVFCTSRTRAEVEVYRSRMGNRHPFIVENGGALFIPERYFSRVISSAIHRDGYAVIEFGSPYSDLVQCLYRASTESGCATRGFHQMSAAEIGARRHMSPAAADLAKQREYDEPFEILSGDEKRLMEAISKQKKRWTREGAFYHLLDANDKAHCVNLLIHFYTRIFKDIVTVGLGDGLNDAGFLNLVDIPILMKSPAVAELKKAIPRGREWPGGPEGWNSAVLDIVLQCLYSRETDLAAAANGYSGYA